MTTVQITFIVAAAVTLGAAIMVVTTRKLLHAAVWLILSLLGVAVFYVLLNAGFLAVAQLVIYIGAIAILMIFAIMLTRHLALDIGPQVHRGWPWALLIAILLFGGLIWLLSSWSDVSTELPVMSSRADPLTDLGVALVSPNAYVIPFELASILLLAALIGAIYVAWPKKEKEG